MVFSLFTYNTLFNNALDKIQTILKTERPDILCLQEVLTDEENLKRMEKLGYKLADYSNSFIKFGQIFGVATFYNPKRFKHLRSASLHTGRNLVEVLFTLLQVVLGYKKPKTFLRSDFMDKKSGKVVSICNIHLYVVGSNQMRIRHIKQALVAMKNTKKPLILTGDFNYLPYQRRRLETFMNKNGFTEATRNISQTIKFTPDGSFENFNLFQKLSLRLAGRILNNLKIDYIFFRQLSLKKTKRVEVRFSDHFPIISDFSL